MAVPIEDVDGRCNCLAVCKAARYLRAAYDKALAPSGLRMEGHEPLRYPKLIVGSERSA